MTKKPEISPAVPTYKPWLILGSILLVLGLFILGAPAGLSAEGWIVACLTILMAIWWVGEAIPIPVTALLPLVILPVTGVMPIEAAAIPYAHKIILLLMGGFIIAKSVERWNLHTRIALHIVARAGARPAGLVGGFMVASAILSMWISNTATTIMLTPIALSVAYSVIGDDLEAPFLTAILLAIPYGASIGGLGTPVGTPTNLIVMGYLEEEFDIMISFAEWMRIGLPVVVVMLPAAFFVLTKWGVSLKPREGAAASTVIRDRLLALGPMSTPERRVLICFLAVALCWIFRKPLGYVTIAGIEPFAGLTDHVIAIAGAVLLFLIPSGSREHQGTALLDWETAVKIPWGVLLLFGGGLSLAAAIKATGLAVWLGGQMSGLTALPLIFLMLVLVTFVIFSTELTSNIATASALLPVIGTLALIETGGVAIDPLLLSVPVAMAASCAFMLPIATGPNAIVFASGHISIKKMALVGLRLNVLGVVLITAVVYLLAPLLG